MSEQDTTQTPEVMEDALQIDSQPTIEDAIPQAKDTVGLSKYLDEKNKRKEAEAQALALQVELERLQSQGGTKEEMDDAVEQIAQKYTDVAPELLNDIVSAAERRIEQKYGSKLASIEAERQRETVDKKFNELYTRTLSEMPEYSGVVNPEVIKSLALNPANAKKTMQQIVEEAYGNAIVGRKTLESTSGATRRNAGEIDFSNMNDKDWEAVESDPELKKKHSEYTLNQLRGMF